MTITAWIATHSDGTTCTVATTTANCPHNHTYTAPTDAPGTKGLLITTAGELAIAAFAELEDYQRAVGGYIETVSLDDRHDLIANEEGLIQRLPMNLLASTIAKRPLVGDVVIVGFDDASGDFVDVDDSIVDSIRRAFSA
ncbi:DUF3846 domain-containing protein [Microbacterium sp. CCH5-D1]|uniref:DUF3846 domain-containing protein n=1 Tax=Microbacterium sp. CCH5-D1 TaxID=1768780 RepID=UPI00076A45E3|nr:DUF3846 domain-containing protein [Microbacterium sp. CCH5-D1]